MKQIEYNLLEERWVRVRGQDYTVQEVSPEYTPSNMARRRSFAPTQTRSDAIFFVQYIYYLRIELGYII